MENEEGTGAVVALRPLVAEKPTAVEWKARPVSPFPVFCFLVSQRSLVRRSELELASLLASLRARTVFQVPFPGHLVR